MVGLVLKVFIFVGFVCWLMSLRSETWLLPTDSFRLRLTGEAWIGQLIPTLFDLLIAQPPCESVELCAAVPIEN